MYGLDYLFNEEDYYEPKEIKSLLMVALYYMKAKEIKMLNYHYGNILTKLDFI